ncbi:uncharacterized protein LOC130646293 [Hydractinia symbiolongicarpus]|uniref:uncharacterized protein LOC130646293 n=1 Tax=Hydractinia symbiolongicarpus TaxID=13093 RepID=UPI00254C21A1|nr:uncharacterized protein LOC130646293 [Hydractinia symbiolongicarpus]
MLKWQKLNSPLQSDQAEYHSLKDIIKREELPILVQIVLPCFLKTKEVLKSEQDVTILKKKKVTLVMGKDVNGMEFRFNACEANTVLIDRLVIFSPDSVEMLAMLYPRLLFVPKKDFTFSNYHFYIGKEVVIADFHNGLKPSVLIHETKNPNCSTWVPCEILLHPNLFSPYLVKETLAFEEVLKPFEPQSIRFHNAENKKHLPNGIVTLKSVKVCDLVVTATTKCSGTYVRYEIYPLNSKIMAKRSQNDLPEHMKVLGKEHSNEYQSYLNHIENLFHYDLYGPRFYGFLDVNNQKTDVESEPIATSSILQVINHLRIKR